MQQFNDSPDPLILRILHMDAPELWNVLFDRHPDMAATLAQLEDVSIWRLRAEAIRVIEALRTADAHGQGAIPELLGAA